MPAPPSTPTISSREVYAPGLRGSLQPELLGATRRHGFIPYVIEPDAERARRRARRAAARARAAELRALTACPCGTTPSSSASTGDEVILRSGTEQRRLERSTRFLRSWERGSNWAFVALPPGELPATATAGTYIRALAGAEPLLERRGRRARRIAPRSRAGRPTSSCCSRPRASGTRRGDLAGATALYRQLLAAAPQHAAARNNLANVLAERGCHAAALAEARAALAALPPGDELGDAVRDTVAELERAAAAQAGAPRAAMPLTTGAPAPEPRRPAPC